MDSISVRVYGILHDLGITPNYAGYFQTMRAVEMCASEPERLTLITKLVYAEVGKQYGVKWSTVERNIRTVATAAWTHNPEAMEELIAAGIRELIVQPTHVINGIENDLMKEDVLAYQDSFDRISFGNPLLTTEEDNVAVIRAVAEELSPDESEALVLMGHGTTHFANSIYAALDYQFKDMGYSNIFLGTVEAYPSLVSLMKQVHAYNPEKVVLAPFMIVAGDHAKNDLSSEDEDSWRSQFEKEGFQVECLLKGLGEYPAVRQLFLKHVNEAASCKA